MIIYFIIYILSFIFAYIAEKNYEKNKFMFYIMSFLAILIPSIFAGLRSSGVGTDTKVYIDIYLNFASKYDSFFNFYDFATNLGNHIEPLFLFIVYISTRIVSNINFGYFLIQFIIMFFAYLACYRAKKLNSNLSMSFAYLTFMFLVYNKTFNLCRQSLAMVIMLSATKFIFERNWKKYFLYLLIACCCHDTAIVYLPLYFIYPIVKNKRNLLMTGILMIALLLVFTYKPLLEFLISNSFIDSSYTYVLHTKGNSIVISAYLAFIVTIIFLCLYRKSLEQISEHNTFYLYILIFAAIIYCIGFSSKYSQRISFYFIYYIIFLIPQIKYIINSVKNKIIINLIIVALLGMFSWWYYDHCQTDQTLPYKVKIMPLTSKH